MLISRYFLHLREGADVALDPGDIECVSVEQLRQAVLWNARDVIAGDALSGTIHLNCRIVAEGQSGAVVHTLSFADAVDIIR